MSSKRCPICQKEVQKAHAPFCSDRCQKLDLHKWLTGQYTVPSDEEIPEGQAPVDESWEQ